MKNNPLISIIVPVYNVEKYLRPCLDSILSQTYMNWEAILVDDGSKDNSGKICDEYAQKDSRFIVVHKENAGVAQARITGFENSKGELITFVDADDYVANDYIEKLSAPIINYNVDMTACNFYDVYGDRMISRPSLVGRFNDSKEFLAYHYAYDASIGREGMSRFLWSKMFKREYVEGGLNAGLGLWFGEDQIAVFDILYNIKSLELIPDVMYFYVQREGQATKKYDLSLWDSMIEMLQRYIEIDKDHIATKMIAKRTWSYVMKTAKQKMISANLSSKTYCQHLSYMREKEYMNNFFNHKLLQLKCPANWYYWLLKNKYFFCFYLLANINNISYRLKRTITNSK